MSTTDPTVIRPAEPRDASTLGLLGASLVRVHHDFDAQRFLTPGPRLEAGYGQFLRTQMAKADVAIFVAEHGGTVVGYVYAGIEPQSWKELRDLAGFIHDVVVDPKARAHGVATRLIETASAWLVSRGAPRVMLWTAEQNRDAQRLFERLGFRRTMVEMTREAPEPPAGSRVS